MFLGYSPVLVTGDFNSPHKYWGSSSNSRKGNILSTFIDSTNLVLLNDKSPTHFNTHGSFSYIDLTFCSSSLATQAQWKIEENLCGSDHFPILISLFPNNMYQNTSNKPKFII